jgi:hypothetical protein
VVPHEHADALEGEEGGVPLVHVAHQRVQPERAQRAQPADPEHDLLSDAVLGVSAVKLVGDVLQVRWVLRHVRVEEVERHAPHVGPPYLHHEAAAGEVELHPHGRAVRPGRHLHRHVVEIVDRVGLLLPPVGAQVLAEVALLVEEPHRHQGDPEVARALEMVPGEDAESARVDRQALGDAVLGGEVGDQRAGGPPPVPGRVLVQVGAQPLEGAVVEGEEAVGAGERLEPLLRDGAEEQHRVLVRPVPEVAVQPAEDGAQVVVPGPAQVVGDLAQAREALGERGHDPEGVELHGRLLAQDAADAIAGR